jgi:predicted acyltransferase
MNNRFLSLDAFRGVTMFLLAGEAALMYESLTQAFPEGHGLHGLVEQFHHHPWAGLRFWDLIQPFFMFIVGVAMPFSLKSRLAKGDTWPQCLRHILWRSLLLFLFGTGLHCVYSGKLVFELWNVLTQLSFTIPVTFLLMRTDWRVQLGTSLLLLAITEACYRAYAPAAPFVMDQNFGSAVDMLLMGKLNNGGGWVTFNCVPTAAHTIWGAICGRLLLTDLPHSRRAKTLVVAGIVGLAIGYGLHWAGLTPIVKRISTTAFVFASGGWALLALALFYWLIDVKGKSGWTFPFVVVGMNSIFIYFFFETVGVQWLVPTVRIFNDGFLGALGLGMAALAITNSLLVWGIYWGLCRFLHRHEIFFRI